jgi:hypothetical protein
MILVKEMEEVRKGGERRVISRGNEKKSQKKGK